MGVIQQYGVYLIVIGALLVIAGVILGYLSSLPNETNSIVIPPHEHTVYTKSEEAVGTSPVQTNESKVDVLEKTPLPKQQDTSRGTTGALNLEKIEQLERITRLRDQGVLSEEQFQDMRQQILQS